MLLNYFKIALRYLLKNRTFSAINIFGLTLGFLCFILITLYLHDELSFDMFHRDANRICRVLQHEKLDDGTIRDVAPVAARVASESLKQIPEVEDAVRISGLGRITVGNDPANRNYERLVTTDANFFTFFDFKLLEGDPKTALDVLDGVVISEKFAQRYFPNQPAFGKRLWTSLTRNDQPVELTVTGIMKDSPKNSHMQIDILFAEKTFPTIFPQYTQFMNSDWTSNSFVTYMKLKEGVDKISAEEKISALVKLNYPTDREFKSNFSLQPLKDIHMYSDNIQGVEVNSNGIKPFYLYMFGGIAFLILLIACLNYMNLSTASALKRTREIGTRKTLGAQKFQLIGQFTGEAIILSAVSLFLALALLQMLMPAVNEFTQKDLALANLPLNWLLAIVAVMLVAGILSSLYPSLIISSVMPADAIKKQVKVGNSSIPMRKMLVVVQFAVSIMMITSTIVIYKQLQYIRSKELGFDLNNLLVIDINSNRLRRDYENIKAQFASIKEVEKITTSTRVPGEWKSFPIASVKPAGDPTPQEMIYVGIDQDFLSTYNIKLLEGRNFVSGNSDSLKVILTKLAVEKLGLKDPVGQLVEIPSFRWGGGIRQLEQPFRVEVIGVADNFHFESFRQEMMPLIFAAPNTPIQQIDYYTLRISTTNWSDVISKLKETNSKLDAENPLEYNFLNDRFQNFYIADEKRGQIFLVFSSIVVIIACLGLFALVSFSIETRTKEIGIRKVLGASVQNIISMVSKEFLLLVIIATLIGIPVAFYMMTNWLEDFAYRITIGVEIFVLSGVIALLIAFATVSFRSIKAALANPVNSLRSE
jgi:putative ABC transport system permease protein